MEKFLMKKKNDTQTPSQDLIPRPYVLWRQGEGNDERHKTTTEPFLVRWVLALKRCMFASDKLSPENRPKPASVPVAFEELMIH